jgi:IS30 family transposase
MRRLEQEIMNRNNERRNLIRSAWKDDKLPQRQIANALGLTNQTVWNEIHRKDNDESATK